MSGIAAQTVQKMILPVNRQQQNNTTTTVRPDAYYRPVTKFGENGHGIWNPPKVSPIIPSGGVFY